MYPAIAFEVLSFAQPASASPFTPAGFCLTTIAGTSPAAWITFAEAGLVMKLMYCAESSLFFAFAGIAQARPPLARAPGA
jgi:hypothetical protein